MTLSKWIISLTKNYLDLIIRDKSGEVMAFSALEYLSQGNIDFYFNLSYEDKISLIDLIRNADNKNDIINGFLSKLIDLDSTFCFRVIYDNDAYEAETRKLLAKGQKLTDEMLINLLSNSTWGVDYYWEHITEIESNLKEETIPYIFAVFFKDYKKYSKLLAYYRAHPNMHIRVLFMKYILVHHENLFEIIYPDLFLYLSNVTYKGNEQLTLWTEFVPNEDICDLAYLILKSKYKDKYFNKLKEFILAHYPKNDLAKVLIEPIAVQNHPMSYHFAENKIGLKEFSHDPDRLFLTSETERFYIMRNYPDLISSAILESYKASYRRFRKEDEQILQTINAERLESKLFELIDKYLSISTQATWRYIASGSTGTVYQLGDFVLKMFSFKWSYEDVICPNLFLIVKNYEEIYIRDEKGIVLCGLEVQPYLAKSAKDVAPEYLHFFESELDSLGYKYTDRLMEGPCGDNCRVLDSYKQADCINPEKLPDWFKEVPLVLVDRDRIYPKDEIYIRELSCYY